MKIGRNDPCHCGSGEKYKKCHLLKEEAARAAEVAAAPPAETPAPADADPSARKVAQRNQPKAPSTPQKAPNQGLPRRRAV